jgi:ribosomal protein S18 acetylase RimI-like enzyme
MQAELRIGPAALGQEEAALRLVFSDLPVEEQNQRLAIFREESQRGGPQSRLLTACLGAQLVGAIVWQLVPGKVGALYPPRTTGGKSSAIATALLTAACNQLQRAGAGMVQCLLRHDGKADKQLLVEAGFEHFGDLFYLVCEAVEFPQSAPSAELVFEPYRPAIHAEFAALVEATYEGTLDCPRMNGVRTIDETLDGYRGEGQCDPSRWLVVRRSGAVIGCLLLADYPDQENYELVYMGLVPAARGHGWGKRIARHAQWRAREAGRQRLVVAADAANLPALRMYTGVGFRVWDRRSVLVRVETRPK